MTEVVSSSDTPVQFTYKPPPSRKRKNIRQKEYDDDEAPESKPSVAGDVSNQQKQLIDGRRDESADAEERPSLSDIAKLRKKVRARQGLQLTVDTPKSAGNTEEKTQEDVKKAEFEAIANRFTHQTGQILDVDKHMMEYIEKKLSSKYAVESEASRKLKEEQETQTRNTTRFDAQMQIRGATLGKLHEVDLGEEIKLKNIARTEEATRRLEGGEPEAQDEDNGRKRRGKRRRRNSQDIQRDKLVEEVLKETRLEIYDEPEKGESEEEGEGATDDKIVERFRKEFLDALNLRKGRRRTTQTAKKKDDKQRPKGPKLGGSRMARAAMREQQTGTKK